MKVPNEADWGVPLADLDEQWAYGNFFGKSLAEAERLFEESAITYQEDLMWMPPVPFRFYLPAFINYLKGEKSKGDSDGASSFINLIKFKLTHESSRLAESWSSIESALHFVKDRQEWYDADKSIYGDFHKRVDAVLRKARRVREVASQMRPK